MTQKGEKESVTLTPKALAGEEFSRPLTAQEWEDLKQVLARLQKDIEEDKNDTRFIPEMIKRDARITHFPAKTEKPPSTINALTKKRRKELLRLLHLAMSRVWRYTPLPPNLVKELETFKKRFNATADEGNILNLVRNAHYAGAPLNKPVTIEEGAKEVPKETAFDVAAKQLGMNSRTVYSKYCSIVKANKGAGLPNLANTPKPQKQRKSR